MNKKVVYAGFHGERLGIVDYLSQKNGWDPVFFICEETTRIWAQKHYPKAKYHNEMALRKAYFDYSMIGPPVPIDAKIIAAVSKHELNFLNNACEDSTGWNFSFAQRRRYYYDLLKYLNTMVHRLKPDLFVTFTWPHTSPEYALYHLCKEYYSIDVLFFDPMPLLNKGLHLVGTTLEDLSMPVRHLYESKEALDSSPEVLEYLAQLKSDQWVTPRHNLVDWAKWEKQKRFQCKELMRAIAYIALGKAFQEGPAAIKKNKKPFESPQSKLTNFEHFWYLDRLRRKDMQLEDIYISYCETPDFKKKYLYFAGSQQPEAVTATNSGVYEDLVLALDILSASIPGDWLIYYKEHPATFSPKCKGSMVRNRYYYEKIKSFKNIQMISHKTDNFKLIDHAQAVASVAGTTSWEAAARGKPALFFGNVWYQACRSLFRIETLEDCQNAINKIIGGYVPDPKDIERYLASIEKSAFKGLIHSNFGEKIKESPNPQDEIVRMADALQEAYKRYYT